MASNYGRITVIAGSGAGKSLNLQKPVVEFGSGKSADLRLDGEKVSESHASIESLADGSCVLRNRSPFGTLVNKIRVDVHKLADGDRIQIGAAALLEYRVAGSGKAASGGRSSQKKLLVSIGLGIYLIAMLAVAIKLQGMQDDANGVPKAELEAALAGTRDYVQTAAKQVSAGKTAYPTDVGDSTASYFQAINAQPTEASAALEQLMTALRKRLQDGSALERQERWRAAQVEYRVVLEMLPDLRLPAAQLAASRLAAIRERIPDAE